MKLLLLIYGAGMAIAAFAYGYFSDPPTGKDVGMLRADAVFFAGMWPIWVVITVLATPIWVPMAMADFGAYMRARRQQKEAVQKALDYAKLASKDSK